MTLEQYQEVALTRDLPEYQLRAGDIATLVDFVSHPSGGEEGCLCWKYLMLLVTL